MTRLELCKKQHQLNNKKLSYDNNNHNNNNNNVNNNIVYTLLSYRCSQSSFFRLSTFTYFIFIQHLYSALFTNKRALMRYINHRCIK